MPDMIQKHIILDNDISVFNKNREKLETSSNILTTSGDVDDKSGFIFKNNPNARFDQFGDYSMELHLGKIQSRDNETKPN